MRGSSLGVTVTATESSALPPSPSRTSAEIVASASRLVSQVAVPSASATLLQASTPSTNQVTSSAVGSVSGSETSARSSTGAPSMISELSEGLVMFRVGSLFSAVVPPLSVQAASRIRQSGRLRVMACSWFA